MSHGYDYFDRDYDEWAHHMIMFTFVTCPTVLFMLYIFYFPDHQLVLTHLLALNALYDLQSFTFMAPSVA